MPKGKGLFDRLFFRTVYLRMIAMLILVVLAVMITLGLILGTVFRRQYYTDRINELRQEVVQINKIVSEKYPDPLKRKTALEELSVISRMHNGYIWIVNLDKVVELRVIDSEKAAEWQVLEVNQSNYDELYGVVLSGQEIEGLGFFNSSFQDPVMTYASPWVDGQTIKGAIFFHTKIYDLNQSIWKIYINVLNSSFLAMILAIILASITARSFTKPLVAMNRIAKSYAKGDFSERVEVKSIDEIGQLANSFNMMAKDLSGLENMRRSFVANVSHELKAPLASMRGFLQAVLDGSVPQEDQNEYLNIVLEETVRLNLLINDLLDISKMESGKVPLNIESFDINELIRRILITFESRIEERNLEIIVRFNQNSCFVDADSDKIAQVVRNLIDNAIKYSHEHATLMIISHASQEKRQAYITVKDNGIGIPEEDLPHIFERFYKVEKAHTPGSEGTGLGLAIVRHIIDEHKTQIHIFSKVDQGTSFCFLLPLSKTSLKK